MDVLKWMGIAIPLIQMIFTRVFDARVFYFIAYTINMQNLAFLPSLGVNNPSQVAIFVKSQLQFSTFNIYLLNDMWGWTFKWIDELPTAPGFERIGIVNRALMSKIGTLVILAFIVFCVWAIASALLKYYKNVRGVGTIIKYFSLENSAVLGFMFFYLIYM